MRVSRFILLFSLALSPLGYAQEQQDVPPAITYDVLLNRLDKHPSLEAVRQQVIEQREAASGAGGLPDPMLTFGINNYPADGRGGFDRFAMTSKSIGLMQVIPNSGVRAASVAAKEQLAAKAQLAVAFTRQQLVAALNSALAGRERVARQHALALEDVRLLKQEAAYWNGRLQAGDSALDERSRVDAEQAQAEARLATLEAEKTQFDEELKRLTGEAEQVALPELHAVPWPNVQPVYPVLLAEADVKVAKANEEGAESAFGPNYQVGVSYAQRDNSGNFDGGDFVSAQFGVSVPLWAHWNQAPKLRSAKAGVGRAEAMLADVRSQWQQQLATQYARIRETEATEKALQEKEQSLHIQIASLRNAYESDGRMDKLIAAKRNVLALQVQLADVQARYVQQVSGYNAMFQMAEMPVAAFPVSQTVPQETPYSPTSTGDHI